MAFPCTLQLPLYRASVGFSFRIHADADHLSPCHHYHPDPKPLSSQHPKRPSCFCSCPLPLAYSLPGLQELCKYIQSRGHPSSSQFSRGGSLLSFIWTLNSGPQALCDMVPATAQTFVPCPRHPPPHRTCRPPGCSLSGPLQLRALPGSFTQPSSGVPSRAALAVLSTAAHVLLIL